jgi:hypothetical protein
MGVRLVQVVTHIRQHSRGLPNIDLARLNLRLGHPISRYAADLPDTDELVEQAWRVAREILSEGGDGHG